MAQIVPIEQVIHSTDTHSKWFVNRMRDVLVKQGQIEPLQVQVYAPKSDLNEAVYITFDEDPHGAVIVRAAQSLGWPTLLIVEMNKYEQ